MPRTLNYLSTILLTITGWLMIISPVLADTPAVCSRVYSCANDMQKCIVRPTLAPTRTPTTRPVIIPSETLTITQNVTAPTDTPIPTGPTIMEVKVPQDSIVETIFNMINEHRQSLGLAPFQKEERLCQLAVSRGPELAGEVASGDFHKGLYDRNLPYWVTENMAYYGNAEQDMNFWLHSDIHKRAIEGDYIYSCGFCQGNACIQLFTNFTPK